MHSGALRHSITIQRAIETQDNTGQITQSWVTLVTVFASILPVGGIESKKYFRIIGEETHNVIIRYYAGLTTKDRILYGARVLNILSIDNIDERNVQMNIKCKETLI